MQEREHYCEILPAEISPFPLTEESVKRSLGEIAKDPLFEYEKNFDILETENGAIYNLIDTIYKEEDDDVEIFEGSVFAYKLIRDSAINKKTDLPVLSDDSATFFIYSFFREVLKNDQTILIKDFLLKRSSEIRDNDPNFIDSINELCKYRAGYVGFYYGAILTYCALQYSKGYIY